MLFSKSSLMTVLGLVQILGIGSTTAYPTANEDWSDIIRRQPWPDERKNLTFDNILIPNEKYCNSGKVPQPYEGEYFIKNLFNPDFEVRVYNTTQNKKCREHADHQGPFWRAYSYPNVVNSGGSLNISRSGPWREGGFGVLSLALGTEKDSEVAAHNGIIRINMDGKSRTGGNIAAAEFDFPAQQATWGNYGPWFIKTTAGFDIGLREFHVRAEYRWKGENGTEEVRPVGTLWVDHVQVRVVKLD